MPRSTLLAGIGLCVALIAGGCANSFNFGPVQYKSPDVSGGELSNRAQTHERLRDNEPVPVRDQDKGKDRPIDIDGEDPQEDPDVEVVDPNADDDQDEPDQPPAE